MPPERFEVLSSRRKEFCDVQSCPLLDAVARLKLVPTTLRQVENICNVAGLKRDPTHLQYGTDRESWPFYSALCKQKSVGKKGSHCGIVLITPIKK